MLETFDCVAATLAPTGVFIAPVPNAMSPFGGMIRHGDFSHESWYTARSVRQLAAAAGFISVTVRPCPPGANGFASTARLAVWKSASALCKFTLAAETGTIRGHIVTQSLTFLREIWLVEGRLINLTAAVERHTAGKECVDMDHWTPRYIYNRCSQVMWEHAHAADPWR